MSTRSSSMLYIKIKNYLLSQIKTKLSVGDKLPTEAELMKQFSVSRITINKALTELKEEGYIVRYPSKGSFVASSPSSSAQPWDSPATQSDIMPADQTVHVSETTDIMCVFPNFSDQFALNIFNGINTVLPPEEYAIHLIQSATLENEDLLLKKCFQSHYKGLILIPSDRTFYSDYLLHMKLNNFPIVCIDRHLPGIDTGYVISDNVTAAKMIYQHLHTLGHRNILFVSASSKDVFTTKKRIKGLHISCEEMNLLPSSILIKDKVDIHTTSQELAQYFTDTITKEQITAIICSESYISLWMFSFLEEAGLRVPKDISLVSFDNPINTMPTFDFFTHINQNEFLMGQKAAEILLAKLENRDSGENEHIILPPSLEIRSSTANV